MPAEMCPSHLFEMQQTQAVDFNCLFCTADTTTDAVPVFTIIIWLSDRCLSVEVRIQTEISV